jgi:hypothetical protein
MWVPDLGLRERRALLTLIQPDLPARIMKDIPFNDYDRSTFYLPESPAGYIDYPAAEEEAQAGSATKPVLE